MWSNGQDSLMRTDLWSQIQSKGHRLKQILSNTHKLLINYRWWIWALFSGLHDGLRKVRLVWFGMEREQIPWDQKAWVQISTSPGPGWLCDLKQIASSLWAFLGEWGSIQGRLSAFCGCRELMRIKQNTILSLVQMKSPEYGRMVINVTVINVFLLRGR